MKIALLLLCSGALSIDADAQNASRPADCVEAGCVIETQTIAE